MRTAPIILTAFVLLSAAAVLAGCEGDMQDPWVGRSDELQQERQRTDDQAYALRERLRQVQTDR